VERIVSLAAEVLNRIARYPLVQQKSKAFAHAAGVSHALSSRLAAAKAKAC
jgi:hypothetical protein